MTVSGGLYLTFYIFFLILLAIFIWFILYYSKVPGWVWTFYGLAILIFIIGGLIKQFLMVKQYNKQGEVINSDSVSFWSVFYTIAHIIAFILLIIGFGFTIGYSKIPWWVWVLVAGGIIMIIIAEIIVAYFPGAWIICMIVGLLGFLTVIVGIIFLVIYSDSPWWIWLIIGLALIFLLLAGVFQGTSLTTDVPKEPGCCQETIIRSQTPIIQTKEVLPRFKVIPVNYLQTY